MKTNELTKKDKITLLANLDARERTSRDEEFEKVMAETLPPALIQIADPVRYALVTYIKGLLSELLSDIVHDPKEVETHSATWLTIAWLHGYQVALKWGRPIDTAASASKKGE